MDAGVAEFVRRSLDDLEREYAAGELSEEDYLALRAKYEQRSAEPSTTTAAPRRSLWRPLLWVVVVAALGVSAALLVAQSAGERLPGEPASGSITPTGPSEKLLRAQSLVSQGKVLDAVKLYDEVLLDDPRNAVALAQRGWLLRLTGRQGGDRTLIDKGLAYIDRAIASDPRYGEARFFRGMILYEDKGDAAGAVPEFRAFLGSDPPRDMIPLVEDILDRALRDSAAGTEGR